MSGDRFPLDMLDIADADALSLSAAMSRIARRLGFHSVIFVRHRPAADGGVRPLAGQHLGSMPAVWMEHYVAHGYGAIDPVLAATVAARAPFTWAEVESGDLDRAERKVLAEARSIGLCHGVVVPLPGRQGCRDVLSAAADHDDFDPDAARTLRDLAIAVQALATRILPDPLNLTALPRLTERERQVLHYVLIGKTNGEIGDLLGVSEHTIAGHVASVLRRWPVPNRRAAAYLAARLGLIAA